MLHRGDESLQVTDFHKQISFFVLHTCEQVKVCAFSGRSGFLEAFQVITACTYGRKERTIVMSRSFCVLRANSERVGYLLSLTASNDANRRATCDYEGRKQAFFIVSGTRMCMYY